MIAPKLEICTKTRNIHEDRKFLKVKAVEPCLHYQTPQKLKVIIAFALL